MHNQRFMLLWKVVSLLVLTLLMLIPVSMIMEVIDERQHYQREVIQQVNQSVSGSQTLSGPLIVIPYIRYVSEKVDKEWVKQAYQYHRYILPEELNIQGKANVDARHIEIYQTQVYQTELTFSGRFSPLNIKELFESDVELGKPYLVFAVSNSRGILSVPVMTLANELISFEPGAKESGFSQGVHAPNLPESIFSNMTEFNLKVFIQGAGRLAFIPLGRTTELQLTSNWPHPNFIGDFLPISREIKSDGFTAVWRSSWFANNVNDFFAGWEKQGARSSYYHAPVFSSSFVETVDEYQLNQRAVKYAILFIGLTFVAFFLFEILSHLPVHPIQYLLVGFALVIFYLLLLALSEQMGFYTAYIVAAIACCSLITFYLRAVLKGFKVALIFGVGLFVLYGVLFFLMQSEDRALLLGSGLLFIILSGIMVLTRNIDWYKIATIREERKGGAIAIDENPSEKAGEHFRLWK